MERELIYSLIPVGALLVLPRVYRARAGTVTAVTPRGAVALATVVEKDPGDNVRVYGEVQNVGNVTLHGLKVAAYIMGLNLTAEEPYGVDLGKGATHMFDLTMTIPEDADPGEYEVWVRVSDNQGVLLDEFTGYKVKVKVVRAVELVSVTVE